VTEERAVQELLENSVELGLLALGTTGFHPPEGSRSLFKRLAFALYAIEHYVSAVHLDASTARVVLTKPPRPSVLEQKLSELGWRTSEIEPTEHAFHSMVRLAQHRVVVMTPFFDLKGALWLRELFVLSQPSVEKILILRSLEDTSKKDYPTGFDAIERWLKADGVKVYNYSIPRFDSGGRETFHAKVVLCDRDTSYVGSSNINTASLEHSMEMGILLRGKASADVATVIDSVLMAAGPWRYSI